MIEKLGTVAHLAVVNPGAPQVPASADVLSAAHNLLAAPHVVAAAQQVSTAGSVGATLVCMGAYAWYEVKHKGWDWVPFLFGGAFFSILSTTALSPVVTGTGTAIGSIFGSVFTALSSIAS